MRTHRWTSLITATVLLVWGTVSTDAAPMMTVTFQQGVGGYTDASDTHIDFFSQSTDNSSQIFMRLTSPDQRVPLIRFDNIFGNGGGQIPLGSSIASATLTLTAADTGTPAIAVHRMLLNWADTVTWDAALFGGDGISEDNVEAVTTPDFSSIVNTVANSSFNLNITSAVEAWSNGAANFGVELVASSNVNGNFAIARSADHATASTRPLLTVEFFVPEPASAMLLSALCLFRPQRRSSATDSL